MIGDLMEVTRAEAGKLRVEVAPLQVDPFVRESVGTLHSAAAAKGISLGAETSDSLPTVLGDESRIRQVLGNLIENAIKFTPEGGSISVSAAREPVHGADWVRVSVTDTGCGISKGGQKKVFSRLHQENLESSETRKGLGLGLAICKELICLQGGGSRWRAGRAPEAPSTSRCRCFPWRGSWRRRS
jgi:signal transduction histidine kinase